MRASEWQFLCAVHDSPKSCCAIDYCCHTLDWATNVVTSQKIFPSRLSLGAGDAMDERGAGVKHLVNIFRRLHRIFAHAWFQHREVFWRVEGQTGLYVLFKTVCDNYELLPAENYKLPPEAEGLEPVQETKPHHTILKPEPMPPANSEEKVEEEDPNFMAVGRTNTRRHIRSSPSTGAAVTTVPEADEDDTNVTQKLVDMHISEEDAGIENKEAGTATEEAKFEIEAETEAVPKAEVEAEVEAQHGVRSGAEAEAQVEAEPQVPAPIISEGHPASLREHGKEEESAASPEEEAVANIPLTVEDITSPTEKEAEPEGPASIEEAKEKEDK
jgi:hypothetical protein